MKKIIFTMAIVVVFVFTFMAGNSQASFIGKVYEGASAAAQNPAQGPGSATLTATFTVDKLNFDSRVGNDADANNTYNKFLASGSGNNLIWTSFPNVAWTDTPIKTASGSGTFFQFTGTAYFAANITITHDDGFWLQLGNLPPYDYSTPTGPIGSGIGNPAGIYSFTLNYGAWNGFPEVLKVPTAPVPIPAAVWLFGTGLLGLFGVRRKISA